MIKALWLVIILGVSEKLISKWSSSSMAHWVEYFGLSMFRTTASLWTLWMEAIDGLLKAWRLHFFALKSRIVSIFMWLVLRRS